MVTNRDARAISIALLFFPLFLSLRPTSSLHLILKQIFRFIS